MSPRLGRPPPAALILAAGALLVAALPAGAAGESDASTAVIELDSGRRLEVFPRGHLVRPWTADPQRPGSAILVGLYPDAEIEEGGEKRFTLALGGRFGLLRWLPAEPGGRTFQLNLEAGLDAQFDIDNSLDNIGWDGNYGLTVSTVGAGGRVGWTLGFLHTSAHLGDEWIERTGRERIDYTREELRLAVAFALRPAWRVYAEGAWGYILRNEELMDPLRFQAGVELEPPRRWIGGRAGWYAAVDLSSWEERDWRLDVALQVGVVLDSGGRVWRLGVAWRDGRVPLGEFFHLTESALTFGLWSEL